jgi:hypothetical protein
VLCAELTRHAGRPGLGFRIGPDDKGCFRLADLARQDPRRRKGGDRRPGEHRGKGAGAMQVGLDGHHPLEPRPQERPDYVAAQWLAGGEDRVLAQIGQVGRHQHQPPDAGPAERVAGQQQGHQLAVGPVEGPIEQHRLGADPHIGQALPVRQHMQVHRPQRNPQDQRQPAGGGTVFLEGADHGGHGATWTPQSSPAASMAKPTSEGSEP